jgi:hypothetical protein
VGWAQPAAASTYGRATIRIEATFGTPTGSAVPYTGRFQMGGLRSDSGPVEGELFGGFPLQFGSSTTVMLHDGDPMHDWGGACRRGQCNVSGSLGGVGTPTVIVYEPRPGGRLVFDIDIPSAVCPRCPAAG